MIFFGTSTKELGRVDLSLPCPQCNERGHLQLFVLSKYFTMYTFAAFPIEKMGIIGCNACQATFVKREMNSLMLEETEVLMRNYSDTWYKYIVGIIISIITLLSFFMWF